MPKPSIWNLVEKDIASRPLKETSPITKMLKMRLPPVLEATEVSIKKNIDDSF